MRAIIAAIFAILALTAEAYAAEPPFPWELPPEQLGPLLKEQYRKAKTKESFDRHFVHPGDFGNEVLCTSEASLIRWRDGSADVRATLIGQKKCVHEPIGWYWIDYVVNPKTGALIWHHSLWFIDPTGTSRRRLWTLSMLYQMNKPSCEEEIGPKRASELEQMCRDASPATRPPCSFRNTCQMITSEIIRSCDILKNDLKQGRDIKDVFNSERDYDTYFCKDYIGNWSINISQTHFPESNSSDQNINRIEENWNSEAKSKGIADRRKKEAELFRKH